MLLGVARLRRLDVLLADNLEVNEEHEVVCCFDIFSSVIF